MWWKKDEEEEGYGGIVPNVSHNYDSQLYDTDEFGNFLGRKSSGNSSGDSGNRKSSYGTANGAMLDERGWEVPNRFGLKLVLSVLALFTNGILGVLALIFTILQNSAYQKKNLRAFRRHRKASNICLAISLFLFFFVIGLVAANLVYIGDDSGKEQTAEEIIESILDGTYPEELGPVAFSFTMDDDEDYDGYYDDADSYFDEGSFKEAGEDIDVDGMYTITYQGQQVNIGQPATELLPYLDCESEGLDELYVETGYGMEICAGIDGWDTLSLYNNTDEELPASDCELVQIYIAAGEGSSFEYLNGLTEESQPEDFAEQLGSGYEYMKFDESYEYEYYTWYTEEGGSITVGYLDGEMNYLQIFSCDYMNY